MPLGAVETPDPSHPAVWLGSNLQAQAFEIACRYVAVETLDSSYPATNK